MDMVILNRPKASSDSFDAELEVIGRPMVVPEHPDYRPVKRLLDVTICLLSLPVVLPIMLICAIAIKLDSPGPVFFVQERIGKGGRRFRMLKFRTMQADLDNRHHREYLKAFVKGQVGHGAAFKPAQTSQITLIGRFLRRASLDELPQMINVFKGEMSIIGPRPNLEWEVEEYQFWHHERLEVLPGITGLAQVRGRSGIPFERIVNHDVEYVEKMSLLLDLKIMWWTVLTVLKGTGAR
jgi:lipopolysaccharide/colanic/teichoic acid biosynthesis glycosyltransferase